MTMDKKQMNLFKAETTWFHVFVSMIENGDVAKMGPYAVTVYLVVKAYTNWKTGKAFPSIETIAEKSGISRRQVINSLATLAENGYIDKTKVGRKNSYTLREKITLKDQEGRPAAFATWDYLPSTVEAARAELKRFMLTGEYDGKVLYVENLNLSVQINQGDGNLNYQGKMDPAVEAALARLKASFDKAKEKKKKGEPQVQPVHSSIPDRCSPCTCQEGKQCTPCTLTRSFYIKSSRGFQPGQNPALPEGKNRKLRHEEKGPMNVREMIRTALAKQATAPLKEREQAARRPDRTPPDDRPCPTEERAVLVRLPGSYGITTPTPTAPAWPALRRPAAWVGLGGLGVSGASRASPVKAPWPKVSSPPRTGARPPAGARPPPTGRLPPPPSVGQYSAA